MKILKHRKLKNKDKWTIGKIGVCDECKSKVKIGANDRGSLYSRRVPHGRCTIVTFKCPLCKNGVITIEKNELYSSTPIP